MTTPTYDTDFYAWTQAQADAIRAKDLARLDIAHLAEEIESLGIADEHAITRQLQRLLQHLLKWQHQPTHRTRAGAAASTRPVMPSPIGSLAAPACKAFRPSASPWPIGAPDAMR